MEMHKWIIYQTYRKKTIVFMSFHHFYQLFIPFCFYSLQIVCFSTEDQSSQVKYSSNLDDQSEFISSTATNQSVISIENEASPLLKFSTNFFPF